MLKRFRQQKTVSCAVRIGGGQPFEVHGQLLEYGRRLMGAHRLTDEFLNFILSLLDEKACLEIGERLFGKRRLRKSKRRESLFDDDVADILKPDVLAQRISVDLLGGRLGIGAGSLERYLLTFIEKAQRKAAGSAGLQSAMKELARMFGFNEDEIGFVTFLFCKVSHEPFSNLCFNLRLAEYTGLVSIVTGMTNERMRAIIGARQKLQLSGVVIEEEFGDPGRGDRYSLDVNIVDYLTGIAKVSLAEKFCRRDDSSVIPLSQFNVPERSLKVMKALLTSGKPCNILLHGRAGTGKTQFARSLAEACGMQAYFVQHGERGGVAGMRVGLHVAAGTVPAESGVIIMDEADSLLNTDLMFFVSKETADKGELNSFLDRSGSKIIWITNRTKQMEESLLRRFSYNMKFRRFTKKERIHVWSGLAEGHRLAGFLTPARIEEFAARFSVNAGGIASALDAASAILPETAGLEEFIETVEELLGRHQELMGQERSDGMLNPITPLYDPGALNMDCDPDEIARAVRGFAAYRAGNDRRDGSNLNLLFWGRPGTGKTEFAKFLAREASMELIIKRASDLLDCYVGETEKRIAAAFEEAEREKAVLFIDEADSFFYRRERAAHSWEVTFTNEFLAMMENHKGILICCTNLLDNLDRASIRRFDWKTEFRPLTEAGKTAIYEAHFEWLGAPAEGERRRLRAIPDVTFGDFKAVSLKFRFHPRDAVSHDKIISALEAEARVKGEAATVKVGFRGCEGDKELN